MYIEERESYVYICQIYMEIARHRHTPKYVCI